MHQDGNRESPLKGARVLVVHSDPFVAAHLDLMVEDAGGEVVAIATSPEDALMALQQEPIEAVILDPHVGEDGEGVLSVEQELNRRGIPFAHYARMTPDEDLSASAQAP